MRSFLLFIAFLSITALMNAQVGFDYDDAGNQIERYVIEAMSKSTEEVNENIPEEFRLDEENKLLVYPNPTSGVLLFEIINSIDHSNLEIDFEIFSVKGVLVEKKQINSNKYLLDISDQPDGTYFLNIYINGKRQYFTIIKE